MVDANLMKGGVIVVVLLAALAAFDTFGSYAYSQATGAAVLKDGGGGGTSVSLDLSNYPFMFTKNEYFNAFIVVGDKGLDDLAAADIANSLNAYVGVPNAYRKASEVADTFAQNVISVGDGCDNEVTREIQSRFGGQRRCFNDAIPSGGFGALTLYDFGNGKVGLVVEGRSYADTRRAAQVLKSYKDWQASGQLQGKGVLVEVTPQGGTKLSGYGWATATDQTALLPDINLTSLTAYVGGERVVGFVVINNSGEAGVEKLFSVVVRLNGKVVRTFFVGELKKAQSKKLEFDVGPSVPGCGANVVEAIADYDKEIDESKEGNNIATVLVDCDSVIIAPGWNMIGYNTIYSRVETTCTQDQFDGTALSWNPEISDFDKLKLDDLWSYGTPFDIPAGKVTPDRLKAAWLYNKGGSCTINSNLHLPPSFISHLLAGWNMIAVPPDWTGKALDRFTVDCNFEYVWLYDPANAEKPWVLMTTGTSKFATAADRTYFDDKDVGKGFWIYTEKECVLAPK